jgi:hypothetical protein
VLPKQISDLTHSFVRAFDLEHPLETEFRNAHQRFAESLVKRGFGWPSGAMPGIGRMVMEHLENKAEFIWERLQHVITSTEVESYPEMNTDLKSEISTRLSPSVEAAEKYLENLRQGTGAPLGCVNELKKPLNNTLERLFAEVDLFCAKLAAAEQTKKEKGGPTFGYFHGVLGDVTNSNVTVNDFGRVYQILKDHKIPRERTERI